MHKLVILTALVAVASASWNGAPSWGGHGGWNGAGGGGPWAGPPAQVVVQNGQLQDTPEVQAEKAKHFALVSEAAQRAAAAGPDNGAWNNGGQWNNGDDGRWNGDNGQWNGNNQGQWNPQWNGAPAAPAWNPAPAGNPWAGHNNWGGPAAKIVVNNGQVQETPEVAAARAQHFAALARAGAASHGPAHGHW